MTATEYEAIGLPIPKASVGIDRFPGTDSTYLISVVTDRGRYILNRRFTVRPSAADILHDLIHHEAHLATMFLKDFVADWPDQTHAGRREAVQKWKALRRQRVKLKTLFGDACP